MMDFLTDILQNAGGSLSIPEILVNFSASLLLGFVIYLSYRLSHAGAVYSPRFNASLVMLTIVTTLVMNVIGNNVALSLGMVGALSIVRFRTAIKDPRDTAYIFWCIAVGICCGVTEFVVPIVGSGAIFLVMLMLGRTRSNDRYLLVIHARAEAAKKIEQTVFMVHQNTVDLRVKNTTRETCEYIYEYTKATDRKAEKNGKDLQELLYAIAGVTEVNIVMQTEEVSR